MPVTNQTDRQEEYTLQSGEGLFEFRGGGPGGGFDQALLFRGTPVALLWCDCAGSIGQFLVRSRRSPDVSAEVRHLRQVTDAGYADFVLDGHHKLAAFQSLGSPPAVLAIKRLEPPPLTPAVARHGFADAPSFYEGYLRLKQE